MKKALIILLCGVIALTLTACKKKETTFVRPAASTSETPYREPGGNGGVTNVGDGIGTESRHTGTTSSAESKAREDYEYEDDFGTVNILRYHGDGGKIHIPTMIGGKTVTQIDEYAFRGAAVTNVTIPGTVKTVETRAFSGCDMLEILTVAEGVEVIDGYAFANCTNLTLVSLPDSLKELGTEAFRDCPSLLLTYKGQTYTAVNISELYDMF